MIRKVDFTVNRVPMASPPRPKPTATATGRLRPAREVRLGVAAPSLAVLSSVSLSLAVPSSAALSLAALLPPGAASVIGSLPSTDSASSAGPCSWRCKLDLEQLRFLVFEQLVHLGDIGVGELVELALGPADLVLASVAVLDQLVERVLRVPPDVADGDPAVLRLAVSDPDVLAPAFLGEFGEDHPDDRPVVRRIHAEITVADGLLDGAERGFVERLDHDHPGFGDVKRGQLVYRRLRPVILGRDLSEHCRMSTAGADAREFFLRDRDGLLHLLLGLEERLFNHFGSPALPGVPDWPTRVPILSPLTARSTFPGSIKAKTMIGRPLSMQRLTAVESMTLSPRLRTSE